MPRRALGPSPPGGLAPDVGRMLFNIEVDSGDHIVGYVVPDSFVAQAEIVVSRRGEEVLRLRADLPREAIRVWGRHETGNVGFAIGEALLPGLAQMSDLEIQDAGSGLIIYRRRDPEEIIHKKVLRLETQLLPLMRLDRVLQPYFQFYFPLVDRYGLETCQQVFMMSKPSSYASGRILYKSVEHIVEAGYTSIALVQDPFEELAERILVLRLIAQGYSNYLGSRDAVMFEEAIAFAASLPLDDERELKRAFRDLPHSAELALGDPLVRQLTTKLPDEVVSGASIGTALNILSSFQVLGLRSESGAFVEALADLFLLDPAQFPALDQAPPTQALAARLRACSSAEALLENDLALYGYIKSAFEKSGKAD